MVRSHQSQAHHQAMFQLPLRVLVQQDADLHSRNHILVCGGRHSLPVLNQLYSQSTIVLVGAGFLPRGSLGKIVLD